MELKCFCVSSVLGLNSSEKPPGKLFSVPSFLTKPQLMWVLHDLGFFNWKLVQHILSHLNLTSADLTLETFTNSIRVLEEQQQKKEECKIPQSGKKISNSFLLYYPDKSRLYLYFKEKLSNWFIAATQYFFTLIYMRLFKEVNMSNFGVELLNVGTDFFFRVKNTKVQFNWKLVFMRSLNKIYRKYFSALLVTSYCVPLLAFSDGTRLAISYFNSQSTHACV